MVRLTLGGLPVRLQEPYGLDWVEPGIVHPVMSLAEPGKVAGVVVRGVVVKVRDCEACRDLQATDGAALERIVLAQDTPSLGLITLYALGFTSGHIFTASTTERRKSLY